MPETHSRPVPGGRGHYLTERLWALSASLPVEQVPVGSIRELDMDCWFNGRAVTCRQVAAHARRINDADLSIPIILADDGRLMDGGHRVAKALLDGMETVPARRFPVNPPPDWVVPAQDASDGDRDVSAEQAALGRTVGALCELQGEFLLRSGRTATTYFDKYLFEAEPSVLAAVAAQLVPLIPPGTEVVAGLELGGVPVATALSLASGVRAAYVRKVPKAYGTEKLAEGAPIEGRRVLVVEDVISTGGQVVQSTVELRERGAAVDAVLCVIDRTGGDHQLLTDAGIRVISLFTADDLR